MIPKIIFHRSWIYDQQWVPLRRKDVEAPTEEQWKERLEQLEKEWPKIAESVLGEMAAVVKLKWHQSETICSITCGIGGFSDPLTISYKHDVNLMIDYLVHELIHRLLSEEENKTKTHINFQAIMARYKEYALKTKGHVIIHAIHKHLYLKFFGGERLQRDIEISEKYPAYRDAWKIVGQEGHEQIISWLINGVPQP